MYRIRRQRHWPEGVLDVGLDVRGTGLRTLDVGLDVRGTGLRQIRRGIRCQRHWPVAYYTLGLDVRGTRLWHDRRGDSTPEALACGIKDVGNRCQRHWPVSVSDV